MITADRLAQCCDDDADHMTEAAGQCQCRSRGACLDCGPIRLAAELLRLHADAIRDRAATTEVV